MAGKLLPQEIRNDIDELFPTILDTSNETSVDFFFAKIANYKLENLFYNLSNELKQTVNQEVLVNHDDNNYQKKLRWNISLATLKRLDSIKHDWTTIPPLHGLPNILMVEQPLFLEDDDICTTTAMTNKEENETTMGTNTFLPRKNLDDFKIIQNCLKKKETNHLCELENTRFNFD